MDAKSNYHFLPMSGNEKPYKYERICSNHLPNELFRLELLNSILTFQIHIILTQYKL